MKKCFYNTFSAVCLLLIALLAFSPPSEACVDPNTLATVTCNFSEDLTEIEVRIGNLALHTEQPNVFCSCALSGYETLFTHPTYITFVEAGTNTPYDNFDAWDNTSGADDAWNNEYPGYPDWSGYISEVIGTGLDTEDDVELIIRASTPAGYFAVINELDSVFALMTLGTDMWLPDEQTMAFDHTGLRNIYFDNSSFVYQEQPLEYFEQLDNGVLSADLDLEAPEFDLEIFPNPVAEQMWVTFNLPESAEINLAVRDVSGRLLAQLFQGNLPEGEQRIPLEVQAVLSKNNLYLLEIEVDGAVGVRKFVR